MAELADSVLLSRSGTTRLVDRLVAQGLVERTTVESDRRCVAATLTDPGRHVIDQVREERRQFLKDVLSTLPAGERTELVRLFGRVADELRAREQEARS
jgi:DNA-binding MarR family transcriptional regulator